MGVPQLFAWLSERYPKIVARAVEEKPRTVNGQEIKIDASKPNPSGVEVDNLYLDMNGIIHPCCHPEDGTEPATELDMFRAIFDYVDRIFAIVRPRRLVYLAVDGPAPRAKMNQQRARRFRAAKEKRDGTATLTLRRALLQRNGKRVLPEAPSGFDSNCITPGTEFMERLSLALEWYVLNRLDSDPAWANILVLFSDATIPGEGEHKIMDFLREQRKCDTHNPNLRHVLYGADADLIMLGLVSHEPNFTILREEFKRPAKRPCALCGRRGCKPDRCPGMSADTDGHTPDNDHGIKPVQARRGPRFIFVLLPVLREYLGRELLPRGAVHGSHSRALLERRIDDWVFLCFFVGNDFLPHLPSLRIREGAIPKLVKLYLGLPGASLTDGGFLHKDGEIDLARLEMLMAAVGRAEDKIFVARHEKQAAQAGGKKKQRLEAMKGKLTAQQQYTLSHGPEVEEASFWMTALARTDLDDKERQAMAMDVGAPGVTIGTEREVSAFAQEWLDRKRKRESEKTLAKESTQDRGEGAAVLPPSLHELARAGTAAHGTEEGGLSHGETDATEGQDDEDDDDESDQIKFWQAGWKERYYLFKFQTSAADETFKSQLAAEYVKGLCFVLKYYFQGVPSWRWYYPYHYAPFASDCTNIATTELDFSGGGQPFTPLQQLMAVFPPDSAHLLPEPLGQVMVDRESDIAEFYPLDFDTDRNGFRHDWQGVALLPFVDEARLDAVFQECIKQVPKKRRARDKFGCDRLFAKVHRDGDASQNMGAQLMITAGTSQDTVRTLGERRADAKKGGPEAKAALRRAIRALSWQPLNPDQFNNVHGLVRLDLPGTPVHPFLPGDTTAVAGLPKSEPSAACAFFRNPPHPLALCHTSHELPGTMWPAPRLGKRDHAGHNRHGPARRNRPERAQRHDTVSDTTTRHSTTAGGSPAQRGDGQHTGPAAAGQASASVNSKTANEPAKPKRRWRSSGASPFASRK
eukprot:m.59700 g.59700  ORF g.59700 m.59700 type:complete len:976 (-) comp7911_c0_seq1:228-3155(-)